MFECPPWALTCVISGLQKLWTDLQFISSGRSLQVVCSANLGTLYYAVLVSAPGTYPPWLPTCGSWGGSGLYSCLVARSPCQWSLGSACWAIRFVQLQNSFLKVEVLSIWHTSSKYSVKQRICAKLCAKQMSNIWCKNIHTFLRYSNFCDGTFYFASPCTDLALVANKILLLNSEVLKYVRLIFCSCWYLLAV